MRGRSSNSSSSDSSESVLIDLQYCPVMIKDTGKGCEVEDESHGSIWMERRGNKVGMFGRAKLV